MNVKLKFWSFFNKNLSGKAEVDLYHPVNEKNKVMSRGSMKHALETRRPALLTYSKLSIRSTLEGHRYEVGIATVAPGVFPK